MPSGLESILRCLRATDVRSTACLKPSGTATPEPIETYSSVLLYFSTHFAASYSIYWLCFFYFIIIIFAWLWIVCLFSINVGILGTHHILTYPYFLSYEIHIFTIRTEDEFFFQNEHIESHSLDAELAFESFAGKVFDSSTII